MAGRSFLWSFKHVLIPPQSVWPQITTLLTFKTLIANSRVAKQVMSSGLTLLAMFLKVNTSPGRTPMIFSL